MDFTVRRLTAADLAAVADIQQRSPEAAHWDPADYLEHHGVVAICNGRVVGFLIMRRLTEGEYEILNVAIAPEYRRHGVAKHLISEQVLLLSGEIFLEVRESNSAARNLYKYLGFQEVAVRPRYYDHPPESAIVMKFHSC